MSRCNGVARWLNDISECSPNHSSLPESCRCQADEFFESNYEGPCIMSNHFTKRFATVAALLLLSASGGSALAQRGHHGHRGGDASFGIAALKDQLNLNTSQQAMWDNAVAQTKAARDSGRANMQKVKDAMDAELAKAEPDLSAVASVADDVHASNAALRKQVRNTWLAVYATFTPDQKAIVRDALKQRIARMESLRQKMLERRGG